MATTPGWGHVQTSDFGVQSHPRSSANDFQFPVLGQSIPSLNNNTGFIGSTLNSTSISNLHNNNTTTTTQQTHPAAASTLPASQNESVDDMDKYGLKGLLGMIKMENNDQTMIANGTDLSMIGLDMDPKHTKGKISRFFASPWVETSRSEVEPDFVKPASFELSDLSQPEEQMRKFNDETLFFIFYTKTRDIMQELAARELFNRNWRYHKDLQVWLTKDSQVEPIQNTPQSERGVYIFFDPHTWESVRKEFVLFYQSIM